MPPLKKRAPMQVLIACEFSGKVRDAFRKRGHDAYSCDILPANPPSLYHYQGDIFDVLKMNNKWDLIIAHPPCTALCVSGNRHYANTDARAEAVKFVEKIWNTNCEKLVIENPVGVLNSFSKILPKPYYIQPWQFGHGETKKTGLWSRGLPQLQPTNIVEGREARIHKMPPSKDRGLLRSITYDGIAKAMAEQWG
jgi:site-specific DNA-cytosine methylase